MPLVGPDSPGRPRVRLARGPARANGLAAGVAIFRNAAIGGEDWGVKGKIAILALVASWGVAAADSVSLPRPRPAIWVEPRSFAEAVAGLDLDLSQVTSDPTPCNVRLEAMAALMLKPRLVGPGACGGADMVELEAVLLPDDTRVNIKPAAMMHCAMAESLAAWLRDEVAPRLAAKLGSPLTSVENYESYACRSRNRVGGAKVSEHAKGNALDVRAFHLADGRRIAPTDVNVDGPLREGLRDSACRRFTTVLGPGDPYHSEHIHLDVIERRGGYRMCQWEVRVPSPPAAVVPLPRPHPLAANAPVNNTGRLRD